MKKSSLSWLFATWFGCGYAPKAPGTAGALGAIVVAVPLWRFAGFTPLYFLLLSLAALYPSIRAADVVAHETDRTDPQIVVIDEVLGTWLALTGAPHLTWLSFALAFVFFRLFDIWKPPPIRLIEQVPGGAGIVLDDMMAGAYAALAVFLVSLLHR